jgi:hypothetical protein
MTVAELIEVLRALPPGMQVAYVNRCADDGADVVTIDEANIEAGKRFGYGSCNYPEAGIVVLS